MTQLSRGELYQNENAFCTKLTVSAERELSAFFNAAVDLFGPEQAALAAQDWLQQLESMPDLPASPRDWRVISIEASARLAKRVNPCGIRGYQISPYIGHPFEDLRSSQNEATDQK